MDWKSTARYHSTDTFDTRSPSPATHLVVLSGHEGDLSTTGIDSDDAMARWNLDLIDEQVCSDFRTHSYDFASLELNFTLQMK